jgi:hypothetical protein
MFMTESFENTSVLGFVFGNRGDLSAALQSRGTSTKLPVVGKASAEHEYCTKLEI